MSMGAWKMSRRGWLLACAGGASGLLSGCATSLPDARNSRDAQDRSPGDIAARVDRVTWGCNDSNLDQARRAGFAAWLRMQLRGAHPDAMPPEALARISEMGISREPVDVIARRMEDSRRAADAVVGEDAKRAAQQQYQQEMNRLAREAASRHVLRALYSRDQVLERMNWFWLNHFSVHQYKANLRAMLGDYEDTIRSRALGRFRDLLGALTQHPVMLRYLDNDQNAGGRINENHARELLELHTLGVDAGYSQADVQELARVLTGVGVNLGAATPAVRRELQSFYVRDGLFEFNPNRHDFGAKRLLGEPIAARGLGELHEALDRLARHPACARFLCRKLAAYWMSDEPDAGVVAAMVRTFQRSDGDIARVLQTLFEAPAFWTERKFKDPTEYVFSAVRLGYGDQVILNTAPVINWLSRLGEPLYGRQTPDGYPLETRSWSSAGQMTARFEIANALAAGGAGLFRPDVPGAKEQPAVPRFAASFEHEGRENTLSSATRVALAQATSPQERNAFLLSSPEFMQR